MSSIYSWVILCVPLLKKQEFFQGILFGCTHQPDQDRSLCCVFQGKLSRLYFNLYLLFVLKFLEQFIVNSNFFVFFISEFDIKTLRFFIDASIKILIVISKFRFLIPLQPQKQFIFSLIFLFLLHLLSWHLWTTRFMVQNASLKSHHNV